MLKKTQNQELSEEGEGEGTPEAGTSSDGEKKTGAKKWESGIKRGPANPIGVGKWSETAGTTPVRGHANPLSEQQFANPLGMDAKTTDLVFNPENDTKVKEYTTFWGEKYKIPDTPDFQLAFWDNKKPRASRFKNSHIVEGVWMWDQNYYNPETKKVEPSEELAPDESVLSDIFPDNTLRGIYIKSKDQWFGVIMTRTNDEWRQNNSYFYSPGNGKKPVAYNPDDYIYKTLTTSTALFIKNNWPLIGEVIVSIAAGLLTGGASLIVKALIQAGVSVAFAAGVYAFSDKTEEDKVGLAIGLCIAALPFIPAAINKLGLKGPISGLTKYGKELSLAKTEEDVAAILAKFPEAEQTLIKSAFKEIPKHEFEKVISNKAARGFAAEVRAGKIDLGKLPAYRLRWWQEMLIEGGGAFPVTIGVGYTYKTIAQRRAAEKQIHEMSNGLGSDTNTAVLNKNAENAEKKKKENLNKIQNNEPLDVKQVTNTQSKPVTVAPQKPVQNTTPTNLKGIGFKQKQTQAASDSTTIK